MPTPFYDFWLLGSVRTNGSLISPVVHFAASFFTWRCSKKSRRTHSKGMTARALYWAMSRKIVFMLLSCLPSDR